jgi:hypothetical protein
MQRHKKIIILRASNMPTSKVNLALALIVILSTLGSPHSQNGRDSDQEFGPVVRAYLGYLRNEQEVVDDRASRREISSNYYRRNSNRIKALRQMAVRLARETNNDYLPELEAVAVDEFGLLFERPRPASSFKVGEVVNNTFRFLGTVRSVEIFYLFARLDPYEQAELNEKNKVSVQKDPTPTDLEPKTVTRTRRVVP